MKTTMRTTGHLRADSRKVGWGKQTTSPTFSLQRGDTTDICDNTPDHGNLGTWEALTSPGLV